VLAHEPLRALAGGPGGTTVLVRAAGVAITWLRPGGSVLLELGGDQAAQMTMVLADIGFKDIRVHADEGGQDRAIEGRRVPLPPGAVGQG
jgi:release factor glutamine methyltransferase